MFIELTQRYFDVKVNQFVIGSRFLKDFSSGWEIHDKKTEPAFMVNHALGQNLSVNEKYEEIVKKLIASGQFKGGA